MQSSRVEVAGNCSPGNRWDAYGLILLFHLQSELLLNRLFQEHASKNRERKVELEKRIGDEERDVNSTQKQLHKNTSLLAELVHKKGSCEAQVNARCFERRCKF